MSRYCNMCGNQISNNEQFCPICGSKVVARLVTTTNSISSDNQSKFDDNEVGPNETVSASQSTKKKNWYSENWRRVFDQSWKMGAVHHIAWILVHICVLAVFFGAVYILISGFVIAGTKDVPRIVQPAKERTAVDTSKYSDNQAANETSSRDSIIDRLSGKTTIKNAKVGDIIAFGHYEQDNDFRNGMEDLEWVVLDVEDGKALLITKYVIDKIRYNEEYEEVTWETCSLRQWLNEVFYNNAFSSKEQSFILKTNLENEDILHGGTEGGNDTADKVFCLSVSEILHYFKFNKYTDSYGGYSQDLVIAPTEYAKNHVYYFTFESKEDDEEFFEEKRYSKDIMLGATGTDWWLRSPGCYYNFNLPQACSVRGWGYAGADYAYTVDTVSIGVRPALWISIE